MQASTDSAIENLGWASYITGGVIASDSVGAEKPDPEMLNELMDRNRVSNTQTLMVGNGIEDLKAAKAADVTYFQIGELLNNPENLEPDAHFQDIAEFYEFIQTLLGETESGTTHGMTPPGRSKGKALGL